MRLITKYRSTCLFLFTFLTLSEFSYSQENSETTDHTWYTMWASISPTDFNYNVSGIGRNDAQNINQKQSRCDKSTSLLTFALGEIAEDNLANKSSFASNEDFLLWGNDNGSLELTSTISTDLSKNLDNENLKTEVEYTRFSRIWKVAEMYKSGEGVSKVEVSIPKSAFSYIPISNGAYLMFISDTPTFDANSDYVLLNENKDQLEATYDFNGTKYITFGHATETKNVRSISFDGIDDYIDAGSELTLNNTFTLSAWVMTSGNGTIISKADTKTNQGFKFEIDSNGHSTFQILNDASSSITSSVIIPKNEWHQLAVSYNGNELKLYIDGVRDTQKEITLTQISNDNPFLIGGIKAGSSTSVFFKGSIDEVRVWDAALTTVEIRDLMNQELSVQDDSYIGTQLNAKETKTILSAHKLKAYFPMLSYIFKSVKDESGNGFIAKLKNIDSADEQTAPLPYQSVSDGRWEDKNIWKNGSSQPLPNSKSIVDNTTIIDWNIVKTSHNISVSKDITAAALYVEDNELALDDNSLTITNYLNLEGVINLKGEAQLIQTAGSELDPKSAGFVLQKHTTGADLYRYNYLSSPVSPENTYENNREYTVKRSLKDNNSGYLQNLNFTGGQDGSAGSPVTLSAYWLYTFKNRNGAEAKWQYVGENGKLKVGEGFTMKGPGCGTMTDSYTYTFKGKPNNSTEKTPININISEGSEYLVGNPFASGIDADLFIKSNPSITGTISFWHHYGGKSHQVKTFEGGYSRYNLSGSVAAIQHPNAKARGLKDFEERPDQFIDVAQGFFVTANSTGKVNFDNTIRTFVKTNRQKNVETTQDLRTKLRLGYYSPKNLHREILLTQDPKTTMGIDRMYDAITDEEQEEDFYWNISEERGVIQGIPEIDNRMTLPLEIKIAQKGQFRISIDDLQNFPDEIGIGLRDKETDLITNLRLGDHTQTLDAGTYKDRFEIVFKIYNNTLSTSAPLAANDMVKPFYNKRAQNIEITKSDAIIVNDACLYSILGQEVQKWDLARIANSQKLAVNQLSVGTYILKLNTDKGVITNKLMIN
tara:strand:- start:5008 stop:8154 length:3147 start_codon:yes stop_codon:yes gene_type:complete